MSSRSFLNDSSAPTILSISLLGMGQTLEPRYHLAFVIISFVCLAGLLLWFAFYGVTVWRESAREKRRGC